MYKKYIKITQKLLYKTIRLIFWDYIEFGLFFLPQTLVPSSSEVLWGKKKIIIKINIIQDIFSQVLMQFCFLNTSCFKNAFEKLF